jgi:hypothetical protein
MAALLLSILVFAVFVAVADFLDTHSHCDCANRRRDQPLKLTPEQEQRWREFFNNTDFTKLRKPHEPFRAYSPPRSR